MKLRVVCQVVGNFPHVFSLLDLVFYHLNPDKTFASEDARKTLRRALAYVQLYEKPPIGKDIGMES